MSLITDDTGYVKQLMVKGQFMTITLNERMNAYAKKFPENYVLTTQDSAYVNRGWAALDLMPEAQTKLSERFGLTAADNFTFADSQNPTEYFNVMKNETADSPIVAYATKTKDLKKASEFAILYNADVQNHTVGKRAVVYTAAALIGLSIVGCLDRMFKSRAQFFKFDGVALALMVGAFYSARPIVKWVNAAPEDLQAKYDDIVKNIPTVQ